MGGGGRGEGVCREVNGGKEGRGGGGGGRGVEEEVEREAGCSEEVRFLNDYFVEILEEGEEGWGEKKGLGRKGGKKRGGKEERDTWCLKGWNTRRRRRRRTIWRRKRIDF